jgi:hypothetical protein
MYDLEHFKKLLNHNYQIIDENMVLEYLEYGIDSIKSNKMMIDKNDNEDIKKSLTEEIFKRAIAKKWQNSNRLNG